MTWQDPEMQIQHKQRPKAVLALPLFDFTDKAQHSASDSRVSGGDAVRLGVPVVSAIGGPARARVSSPHEIRATKKQEIEQFFQANLGTKFSSFMLHERWGTAFRTRCSEINNDDSASIVIRNEVKFRRGKEASQFWAERKA